jgi:hypothetical protein
MPGSGCAKRNFLELCVFLGRTLKAPQVRRVDRASKSKLVHVIQIKHRDEVEAPITDWLQEAYELSDVLASKAEATRAKSKPQTGTKPKKALLQRLTIKGTKRKGSKMRLNKKFNAQLQKSPKKGGWTYVVSELLLQAVASFVSLGKLGTSWVSAC